MKFGRDLLLRGIHLWVKFDLDRCYDRLQAKRKRLSLFYNIQNVPYLQLNTTDLHYLGDLRHKTPSD